MKKILLGLVIGIMVALPIGAFAWSSNQIATPTFVARCDGSSGSLAPNSCKVEVAKYDDGKNYCYIAYAATAATNDTYIPTTSISCVKDN